MPDTTFNTTSGQTIARELLILYLNTGTSDAPVWNAIGKRVTDSSMSMDWQQDTGVDILGATRVTMKKPTITQPFDPLPLDSGDAAVVYLWNHGVKDQDAQAMAALDLLVVHHYAGTKTAPFAERYPASAIRITGLGGEGGGNLTMPIEATFGGARETGTASVNGETGAVTFTKAS